MLCLRLSTTLLLAAAWLFLSSAGASERAITCENQSNVHVLSCDFGVVRVQSAQYGRRDRETCSEGRPPRQLANTQCSLAGTEERVRTRCDGKKHCEINIQFVNTGDPCSGIYKYLETNYTCAPAHRVIACEGSLANLYCEQGQVIFIYGADYGRQDRATCSHRRPDSQLRITACSSGILPSNATNVVARMCNGKNSCTVRASNDVFGDPCGGTYKYLEVAYICEYPVDFLR